LENLLLVVISFLWKSSLDCLRDPTLSYHSFRKLLKMDFLWMINTLRAVEMLHSSALCTCMIHIEMSFSLMAE